MNIFMKEISVYNSNINAIVTSRISFSILFISVKCVFSRLKPLDFRDLIQVSNCHL